MIRKYKLIFLFVLLFSANISVCWSESSYPEILKPFIEQDKTNLASSINGDISKIFFIKVFDRLIPVPNRYVLITNESGRHVFRSMAGETIGRALLIGSIEAGVIDTADDGLGFKRKRAEYELLYENYEGMGVNVYVYRSRENINPIKIILINNGREYLIVADQNSDLWENMFKASREFP